MAEKKAWKFDVFLLDMLPGDYGEWVENSRQMLGTLAITSVIGSELDDVDVLSAMREFSFTDFVGRRFQALDTTDRRVIYAEDLYGDGQWWEIGTVKGHKPVYGLRLKGEVA